jgi:hypothetical protein
MHLGIHYVLIRNKSNVSREAKMSYNLERREHVLNHVDGEPLFVFLVLYGVYLKAEVYECVPFFPSVRTHI